MATTAQVRHLKKGFLDHFRVYGNVSAAARAAGIERTNVYRWQEHDDFFAAAYREAEIEATECLEEIARGRAAGFSRTKQIIEIVRDHNGRAALNADGEPRMLITKQEETIEASDVLLMFLLKARAPDKYRERRDINVTTEPQATVYAAEDLELLR